MRECDDFESRENDDRRNLLLIGNAGRYVEADCVSLLLMHWYLCCVMVERLSGAMEITH